MFIQYIWFIVFWKNDLYLYVYKDLINKWMSIYIYIMHICDHTCIQTFYISLYLYRECDEELRAVPSFCVWGDSYEIKRLVVMLAMFQRIKNFDGPRATPPKINIEPENDGLEDDFPLPGVYSQVPC